MTPRGEPRTHKFTMMMTDAERQMLEDLCERDRRSAADWVRIAICDAHGALKKPKPKK